jgi:predicted thioesterase
MPAASVDAYRTPVAIEPGLAAVVELKVSDADTSLAVRSGDVPVLATPRVVALAEEATVAVLAGHLVAGDTTVGYRVQMDHLAPTPIGAVVRAEAILESVEGRRLTFRVAVTDDHGLVAAGRLTRVLVERARFMERAHAKE